MELKTRIFELNHSYYRNLSELAWAMGISVSQIYRVQNGKRNINEKFIVGAMRAFPGYKFDDLFYLDSTTPLPARNRAAGEKPATESTERALERLTSAVDMYGQHLKSHIDIIINLNGASQELKNGARDLDKVLSHIIRGSINKIQPSNNLTSFTKDRLN